MTNPPPTFEVRVTPRALAPPQIEVFQVTSRAPLYTCKYILTVFDAESMDLPLQAQHMIEKLESDLGVSLGLQEPEYREVEGYDALKETVLDLMKHPYLTPELEEIGRHVVERMLERVQHTIDPHPEQDDFPGQYL